MKKILYIIAFIALPQIMLSQHSDKTVFKYNQLGELKSVRFSINDSTVKCPKSAIEFFSNILKRKNSDIFKKITSIKLEKGNEVFEQYYKDVKIDGAGFVFHYDDNGYMSYAHGNYIDISEIDTNPSISKEDAVNILIKSQKIESNLASDITTELTLKDFNMDSKKAKLLLVYKVGLFPIGIYGYVDAQNGRIINIEPANYSYSSSGWFETIYNGNVYASTDYNSSNNKYRLYDNSRGAIIHTRDCNGHRSDSIISSGTFVEEIYDDNNYWYQSERTNKTGTALDVHWALQKIYDRLYFTFNKNSIDNNGHELIAYTDVNIRSYLGDGCYMTSKDNAQWGSYGYFLFGAGESNGPYTEIDVVAHEYGHAITQYQIGWSLNYRYLNEGMSDIWGAIMEYRLGPTGASPWKMGDQLITGNTFNCLRNLENTFDSHAVTKIADAYQSIRYQAGDAYEKSGVFSHWFYLLVQGGSGNNENQHQYSVSGVGMDLAEQLIVKAVYNNYLRYTSSYSDLRDAFIEVAQTMNNSNLVKQVKKAWDAVDVWGDEFVIEGPTVISSQATYSVDDVPDAYNVSWSVSNSYYNTNCLQQDTPSDNCCTITRHSSQDMPSSTLTAVISYNSSNLSTITKRVYAYAGFKGTYYNGQTTKQINLPNPLYVRPGTDVLITSPNLEGATLSYTGSATPYRWYHNSDNGTLNVGMPSTNNATLVVNVNCDNGDSYYLPIIVTTNSNLLSINVLEGYFEVTVTPEFGNEDQQRTDIGSTLRGNSTWTIEVFNATTGECILKQKVEGSEQTFSTSGWKPGIYVVQVTIDDEELTEKIVVK